MGKEMTTRELLINLQDTDPDMTEHLLDVLEDHLDSEESYLLHFYWTEQRAAFGQYLSKLLTIYTT